jgi:hypothetical protein
MTLVPYLAMQPLLHPLLSLAMHPHSPSLHRRLSVCLAPSITPSESSKLSSCVARTLPKAPAILQIGCRSPPTLHTLLLSLTLPLHAHATSSPYAASCSYITCSSRGVQSGPGRSPSNMVQAQGEPRWTGCALKTWMCPLFSTLIPHFVLIHTTSRLKLTSPLLLTSSCTARRTLTS